MAGDREQEGKAIRERAQQILNSDHFAALGVKRTATKDEVGRAFVQAAKTWHPDRVVAGLGDDIGPLFSRVFARLDLARVTLSDPSRRSRYIEELSNDKPASNADVSSAEASLEFKKADAMLKKNDATQAEVHLRRAVQLAPSMVEYQALLISLQVLKPETTKEQLTKLATDLDRLIERDPKCERAYIYRGQLRKRLDRLADAHADFVRAAALNPSNVDAAREVRIYEMRQARSGASSPDTKKKEAPKPAESGAGGFFKKLFKR